MPGRNLFRKQALERAVSPDDLEKLMPVAGAKDWLMIVVLAALLALAVTWSILGRVPTIAAGRGVIVRPRQVVQTQNGAAGRIVAVKVLPGDQVRVGELIATLDQGDLGKRIEEDEGTVKGLENKDGIQRRAGSDHIQLQDQQDAKERAGLEAQRENLQQSLEGAVALRPVLQNHLDAQRKLIQEGLLGIGAREIVDAESAVKDGDAKINDYRSRLSQIDGQLQLIETRHTALARQLLDESSARLNQIDQLRKNIEFNSFQFRRNGNVFSPYSGRVAEVLASPGQVLPAGGKLLTIEKEDAGSGLVSVSYFPVRDGKKIQPGMPIQVTPDTVERERFGGIMGTVLSVSPIPVTREGAVSVVGNSDLVQSLMHDDAYIEVRARLELDPSTTSGYRWSSSAGPPIQITSGLTHATRVTLEGRAPITYLVPILREATGWY